MRYHSFFNTRTLDAVRSSRILIGKQKLGRTFNSDKLGGIDFTKFSKLTRNFPNGVYFLVIIKKTLLSNENSPITDPFTEMGVHTKYL